MSTWYTIGSKWSDIARMVKQALIPQHGLTMGMIMGKTLEIEQNPQEAQQ